MIRYATRLPPGNAHLLDNGLVRKTAHFSTKQSLDFMVAMLNHFTRNPDPMVVPVYDYAILSDKIRDYTVTYDMMRCGILEEDEREFIDHVGWAWDLHKTEVWAKVDAGTCRKYQEELVSERAKLPELAAFLTKVVTEGRYLDLHSGNVMRHEDGHYVLIDLEGFIRCPLEDKLNNWITR